MAAIAYGTPPPELQVIYVNALGADFTGTVDCSAVVRAAQAAAGMDPYLLVFGVGTYLFSSAFEEFGPNQGVWAPGQTLTSFTWSGSGPLITAANTGSFNASYKAGAFTGFSISGPYGNGGVAGIKYGNLQAIRIDDVGFYGLDGGAVLGYAPGGGWAEQAVITKVSVDQCGATSGSIFGYDGTSFDYSAIDAVIDVYPGVDVLALSGGGQMQGLKLALRGNAIGGTSNTSAIVSVDRGDSGGTSYLTNASFDVSMEADAGAGTVGHWLLWMGSSNPASQFSAQGTFNVFSAGATPQGTYNPDFCPIAFAGITLDPSGGAMSDGDALAVMGGTCWTPAGDGFGSPYMLNVYWQFGDVQTALLANGANGTFTFNGASGTIKRNTLLLMEPSSGAAPTASWPANVVWLGGTTPTFASSGRIHEITCKYLPAEATWYLAYEGFYS